MCWYISSQISSLIAYELGLQFGKIRGLWHTTSRSIFLLKILFSDKRIKG